MTLFTNYLRELRPVMLPGFLCAAWIIASAAFAQQQPDANDSAARESKKSIADKQATALEIQQAQELASAVNIIAPASKQRGARRDAPSASQAGSAHFQAAPLAARANDEFRRRLSADPGLASAVNDILAGQVAPEKPADSARFKITRALVSSLADSKVPAQRDRLLLRIYENGYRAATTAQLRENEQLGRMIHAALVRNGRATEAEYTRSASYKRILRRRIYLEAHPEAQKP